MTRSEIDILTQLVSQFGDLNGRFAEQEKSRVALREEDDRWRTRMEGKTDGIAAEVGALRYAISDMPCVMDAKIRLCRDEREGITAAAVSNAAERKVLVKLATDWRTWVAFSIAVSGVLAGWLR